MNQHNHNFKWIILITSIGFFMSMMDAMIVTTATTEIRKTFDIDINTLQWTLNAYNITIAAVLLVGVALGERLGRRKIYNLGIFIFTLGSILCALSNSIGLLIIARVIQAIGASVMTPMSMAILTHAVPKESRGKALGFWSGIGGLALIVGPPLGGIMVTQLSWHWIFWINVPIGLITIYLSLRYLPESKGRFMHINLMDTLLIILGTGIIFWWLSIIAGDFNMIEFFVGVLGWVLFIIFIVRQCKQERPMIPMSLFKSKVFTGGNIATFFMYVSMYGVVFFLPQYLQIVGNTTSLVTGLELLPWTGALILIAPFAGKATDKFGSEKVAIAGLSLQGVGYFVIMMMVYYDLPYFMFILPLILAGAGLSMAGPALQNGVISSVNAQDIGHASGIYNEFRLYGGATGTAISVIIFNQFGNIVHLINFKSGIFMVFLFASILSFTAIVPSRQLRNKLN